MIVVLLVLCVPPNLTHFSISIIFFSPSFICLQHLGEFGGYQLISKDYGKFLSCPLFSLARKLVLITRVLASGVKLPNPPWTPILDSQTWMWKGLDDDDDGDLLWMEWKCKVMTCWNYTSLNINVTYSFFLIQLLLPRWPTRSHLVLKQLFTNTMFL